MLKYQLRGWAAQDLEDILQDTLAVVTERLETVESNPDRFALEVMRNKVGNRLSVRRRRTQISLSPTGGQDEDAMDGTPGEIIEIASPEDDFADVEDKETVEAIRRAIGQLSPLCQAMFTALLENQSVAETWDFLHAVQGDLSRSTFDKRLFDCRKRLRRLLAPNG